MSDQPVPVAALWEWQYQGLCRTTNPDTFFHPEGERGPSRRHREARAKAICQECPVILQCAEHALSVREPYGIWGGMTEDDREAVYRERDRARPA